MEQTITAAELSTFSFQEGEVESYRFEQCDLSGMDLSYVVFVECIFVGCNLSNAKVSGAAFRECRFEHCKMIGVKFDECVPFLQPPAFNDSDLKLCSFTSMKLASIHFNRCQLQECDFTQAVLTSAVFSQCDLAGAIFDATDLRKADLQHSFNYSIDCERNSVKQLHVSRDGLPGLLLKYNLLID